MSLRGIPSSNTLVLLNGRRLVPHPISQSEAGVPTLSTNINQLPNRGLERVEVLRDGASSVYGSDAVAGVINYTMQRNFKGTELALRYGVTDYGDGTEYRGTLTHGLTFARNRGRAILTADYYLREPIYARDRPFSADGDNSARAPAPWQQGDTTAAGAFNARSATTPFGNFLLGTVTATN
ncbi:MAG: TonB-dependent receptor, partial [Verrucomicrobiota bacterium]